MGEKAGLPCSRSKKSHQNLSSRGALDSPDVVVVGAGGCGMVAALAAAQNGAQVILLEKKTEAPGGTTALSGGGIVAAGSRFQRRAGIKDHPARLVEEILSRNGYQSDRRANGVPGRTLHRFSGLACGHHRHRV